MEIITETTVKITGAKLDANECSVLYQLLNCIPSIYIYNCLGEIQHPQFNENETIPKVKIIENITTMLKTHLKDWQK